MIVLLALSACNLDELRLEPNDVDVVTADQPSGELSIATAPDRAERSRADVLDSPLPKGEPIVSDCFGNGGEGRRSRRGGAKPATTGSAAPSPAPAAAPRPRPRPSPPKLKGGGDAAGAPARQPAAEATAAVSEPSPEPEPPPPPADKSQREQQAAKPMELAKERKKKNEEADNKPAADHDATADVGDLASGPAVIGGVLGDDEAADGLDMVLDEREAEKTEVDAPNEPTLDWGATVHLSNDDSMSLASAQRVLYGLSTGKRLSASEIRPHELLNYFSFDTAGAPENQAFSVLGAAEQDGDTLTMSLAVHGANHDRQPMDLTVLLDRSCSMQGEGRMDYTRRGLNLLSDQLQRGDRIDLVLFDTRVCTPLENFVVGRDDPSLLTEVIASLQPTGSTNLDAGLQEAYRIQTSREAAEVHNRNRRVMLVTDANLNTGNVNQAVVSQVGSAFDDHGIRLTGIGVGRDFNDKMLDMLTEKGKGAYVYLGSEAVVDRIFGPSFDSLTRTIAHDVRFSLDLPDSLAMERFYGEEASTNPEDVQPINYYADTTQLFLQDLRIRDGRPVRTDPVVMRIAYRDAKTGEPEVQELRTTIGALMDGDPHNLRKGQALMAFSDAVMTQSLGGNACADPLATYRMRSAKLADDAEIGFVNGLVGRMCGVDLTTVVPSGVAFKVKVDADIPIPEVELECSGRSHLEKLSGSDTVAKFGAVTPGACTVKLQGNVPMAAAVEVPETGGDIRCLIRGGRMNCG